ncbi:MULTISPECIES: hypothetical protein [unclassified Streptosporangium]|uniref:hypothetical protein n=1 Tax=unclassified Streptosporangium TaxID=2632669 RepID=UPI002E2C7C3C|nr:MULTISPECIES: hypothetical protein [unclassified Streptosporangium]
MAVTRPTGCVLGAVLALFLAAPPAFSYSPVGFPSAPHPGDEGGGKPKGGVSAGEVGPPTLSIGVDNGRTSAEKGDRLTYTVTLRNIGTTDARGLHLSQSLPDGLRFVSADHGGKARPGRVTWAVDLKAGRNATVHTTAEVQDTPAHLLRLATVACASAMRDGRPIVCATHSDRLPAGAAAEAEAARAATPPVNRLWYVGGGLLVLVLTGVLAARRARRRAGHHARLTRSP